MFDKMKYFFLYCYEAAEKMEEKSQKFAEEREKRMEEFRSQRAAAEEKARVKIDEIRTEVKNQVKETLGSVGVATKDEIQEVKKLLNDLGRKVDELAQK